MTTPTRHDPTPRENHAKLSAMPYIVVGCTALWSLGITALLKVVLHHA